MARCRRTDRNRIHPVYYVPARNTVLLALALAWAEVLGAYDIFIGVNALDYSGYPDCRPEFIDAFEKTAKLATKAGVEGRQFRIQAPLIAMTKHRSSSEAFAWPRLRPDAQLLRSAAARSAVRHDATAACCALEDSRKRGRKTPLMTMSSERLYYTDAYLVEFDAVVRDVREQGDRWKIVLDRTAFYPTSGGQPFDTGTLDEARVLDVFDQEDGTIGHLVDREIEKNARVRGHVDWSRRFDHMQQHTGQHLLSAAFERETGARTVSFHLGTSASTIDLDKELPADQIARVEDAAKASCGKTAKSASSS